MHKSRSRALLVVLMAFVVGACDSPTQIEFEDPQPIPVALSECIDFGVGCDNPDDGTGGTFQAHITSVNCMAGDPSFTICQGIMNAYGGTIEYAEFQLYDPTTGNRSFGECTIHPSGTFANCMAEGDPLQVCGPGVVGKSIRYEYGSQTTTGEQSGWWFGDTWLTCQAA